MLAWLPFLQNVSNHWLYAQILLYTEEDNASVEFYKLMSTLYILGVNIKNMTRWWPTTGHLLPDVLIRVLQNTYPVCTEHVLSVDYVSSDCNTIAGTHFVQQLKTACTALTKTSCIICHMGYWNTITWAIGPMQVIVIKYNVACDIQSWVQGPSFKYKLCRSASHVSTFLTTTNFDINCKVNHTDPNV